MRFRALRVSLLAIPIATFALPAAALEKQAAVLDLDERLLLLAVLHHRFPFRPRRRGLVDNRVVVCFCGSFIVCRQRLRSRRGLNRFCRF